MKGRRGPRPAADVAVPESVRQCREALRKCAEAAEDADCKQLAGSPAWVEALRLLNQANAFPTSEPDSLSYSTAMAVCAKAGHWEQVLHLLGGLTSPKSEGLATPSAASRVAASASSRAAVKSSTASCGAAGVLSSIAPSAISVVVEHPGPASSANGLMVDAHHPAGFEEPPDVAQVLGSVEASLGSVEAFWRQALELLANPQAVPFQACLPASQWAPEDVIRLSGAVEDTCRQGRWARALDLLGTLRRMVPEANVIEEPVAEFPRWPH